MSSRWGGMGGGSPDIVFCHRHMLQGAVRTSLEKQLGPRGPIASRGGGVGGGGVGTSISKGTSTDACDFPWEGDSGRPDPPLDPL